MLPREFAANSIDGAQKAFVYAPLLGEIEMQVCHRDGRYVNGHVDSRHRWNPTNTLAGFAQLGSSIMSWPIPSMMMASVRYTLAVALISQREKSASSWALRTSIGS